ncbi:BURP domain protein RD22-like [Actinidia eriantha]|uniref:BURP domain protein RD22-like n=1 Tax=Actinidia eriantha TaxID=165200 RepID=UPI002590B6DD|nr:BURP domain protein RD22-like [Actinidia eriantha]
MELHILPFLAFLSVVVASRAAISPEAYWKSMLPNTPMPKAVKDLLPNEWMADKGTSVGKLGKRTNVGVGKGGVPVSTGHKGKHVYHKAQLGIIPTIPIIPAIPIVPTIPIVMTTYGATEDQFHDNPNVALFFMEKDLKKGTKVTLHFTKSTTQTTFLPRQIAKKIPFSSEKMPEIMNYFSVKPDSKEAEIMKKTVKECEEPGIKGEEKYCATSLESMVDFITNKLGKNIQGVSTEVDRETQLQKYGITGVEKMAGDKAVVCHKQDYAYTVFYCHKIQTTKEYVVSLVGADGKKAKAVAVCHMDTSAWNPKHLAFQVLKVKPGTVPICHFLPEDNIVWVPK